MKCVIIYLPNSPPPVTYKYSYISYHWWLTPREQVSDRIHFHIYHPLIVFSNLTDYHSIQSSETCRHVIDLLIISISNTRTVVQAIQEQLFKLADSQAKRLPMCHCWSGFSGQSTLDMRRNPSFPTSIFLVHCRSVSLTQPVLLDRFPFSQGSAERGLKPGKHLHGWLGSWTVSLHMLKAPQKA